MSSTSSAHSPPSPTASAHDESPSQTPESPVPLPPPQTEAVQNSPQKTVVVPDTMIAVPGTQPKPEGSRTQLKTPEPLHLKEPMNGQNGQNGHKEAGADRSPSTPGHLAPFDWDEFEARYEAALADADRHEQELLREFDDLVKFFNVWASAASAHDTERGIKRLQTRERYVRIAEQSLLQKKKHLTEVVRAFQSALALLSQS